MNAKLQSVAGKPMLLQQQGMNEAWTAVSVRLQLPNAKSQPTKEHLP